MTKRISQLNADPSSTNAALAPSIFESERAGVSYRLTNVQMAAVVASAWSATLQAFLATSTLAQAQTALGLTPQQSVGDATAGRVLINGNAYGLGTVGMSVTDSRLGLMNGFYRLNSPYANAPTAAPYTFLTMRYDNEVSQFAFLEGVAQPRVFATKRTGPSTWGTWREFAFLDAPAFTGVPTAPTAAIGTNTTQLATMAALQARILGTVSQSGGVPTGTIIESGTNANGTYVKWADGTMYCARRNNVTRTIGSANGALFGTATAETALAWAQTFAAAPQETVSVTGPGSVTTMWGALAIGTASQTSTGLLLALVSQASNNYSILYSAWGRWF